MHAPWYGTPFRVEYDRLMTLVDAANERARIAEEVLLSVRAAAGLKVGDGVSLVRRVTQMQERLTELPYVPAKWEQRGPLTVWECTHGKRWEWGPPGSGAAVCLLCEYERKFAQPTPTAAPATAQAAEYVPARCSECGTRMRGGICQPCAEEAIEEGSLQAEREAQQAAARKPFDTDEINRDGDGADDEDEAAYKARYSKERAQQAAARTETHGTSGGHGGPSWEQLQAEARKDAPEAPPQGACDARCTGDWGTIHGCDGTGPAHRKEE
jgi:hypothetical protein